jgi:hypothetical protein
VDFIIKIGVRRLNSSLIPPLPDGDESDVVDLGLEVEVRHHGQQAELGRQELPTPAPRQITTLLVFQGFFLRGRIWAEKNQIETKRHGVLFNRLEKQQGMTINFKGLHSRYEVGPEALRN